MTLESAYDAVLTGENREPFVLITGEVGTGKTTALYDVLAEWQTRVVVALTDITERRALEEQ